MANDWRTSGAIVKATSCGFHRSREEPRDSCSPAPRRLPGYSPKRGRPTDYGLRSPTPTQRESGGLRKASRDAWRARTRSEATSPFPPVHSGPPMAAGSCANCATACTRSLPEGREDRLISRGAWLAHTWSRDGSRVFAVRESDDERPRSATRLYRPSQPGRAGDRARPGAVATDDTAVARFQPVS